MASETKRKLPESFLQGSPIDLCDPCDWFTGDEEEAFDKIRQWLTNNKDDATVLKTAILCHDMHNATAPFHCLLTANPLLDIVEKFIKYEPEVLKMEVQDLSWLPIHIACMHGASFEVIQALANGYPESVKATSYFDKDLPLHSACVHGASFEVIKALVNGYPESVKDTKTNGWLPLHCACRGEAPLAVLNFLIESYPEGINQKKKRWKHTIGLFEKRKVCREH